MPKPNEPKIVTLGKEAEIHRLWRRPFAGSGTLPSAVTLPVSAGRHEMLLWSCCLSLPK